MALPDSPTAAQDWAQSLQRQLEFYRWLQSAEGGIAGGATNSWAGRYTTPPAMPDVSGFTTFRQVVWAGSFEGQSTVGLGVRARLPFRVFTPNDTATRTSRLVIDVAHRW